MTGTGRKTHLFVLPAVMILSALAAILVYSNIYTFPFVYDDVRVLTNNKQRLDLAYYDDPAKLLRRRRLGSFTFALNHHLGGSDVFGYHLVNVIVHIVSGWVVLFLSLALLKRMASFSDPVRLLCASSAALIFAVHPVQTQAVTYTVQRITSMAGLFYMVSVLFYFKARLAGRAAAAQRCRMEVGWGKGLSYLAAAGWGAASALTAVMGMICKENAASLPAALLLVEYLAFEKSIKKWKRKLPWFAVGGAVLICFLLYITGFFSKISGNKPLLDVILRLTRQSVYVSRFNYLCTQFNVLVIYLRLLFLPVGQNMDYLYHFKDGFFDGLTPLAFILLCGLLTLGVRLRKKHPVVTFSILWFFITLSVESSIIPIHDALIEHRLYLPMFGYALLVPYLLFTFMPGKKMAAGIICGVVILSLGLAAYHRNWTWRSELALWTDVTEKAPHNNRGWYNLGRELYSAGRLPEAETAYRTAIQCNPQYSEAYNNLGALLCRTDRHHEAIVMLKKALEINGEYGDAHNNLGNALYLAGKKEEAIASYEKALEVEPARKDCYGNLGLACFATARYEEAVDALMQAVKWYPDQTRFLHLLGKAHANLAVLYSDEQRYDLAVKHCDRAEKLGVSVPPDLLEALQEHRQSD